MQESGEARESRPGSAQSVGMQESAGKLLKTAKIGISSARERAGISTHRGGTRAGSSIEDEAHRTLRQRKWTRKRRQGSRKISTPKKTLTRDGQYFNPPAGVRVTLPLRSKLSILPHLPLNHNTLLCTHRLHRTHHDSALHTSEPRGPP